jgi:hypothetical protein
MADGGNATDVDVGTGESTAFTAPIFYNDVPKKDTTTETPGVNFI